MASHFSSRELRVVLHMPQTSALGVWWVRRQLARADAVHEHVNYSDSSRASVRRDGRHFARTSLIINTSYQKLPFGSGDDPDTLFFFFRTHSLPTLPRTLLPLLCVSAYNGCGLPPHVLLKTSMAVPSTFITRRPSHSEGLHGVPRILHDSHPQMGLEIGGHLSRGQRQVSILPAFLNARKQELVPVGECPLHVFGRVRTKLYRGCLLGKYPTEPCRSVRYGRNALPDTPKGSVRVR